MRPPDIVIAQKLANLFNKYLLFRKKAATDSWEEKFRGGIEKFEHTSPEGFKVILHKNSQLSKLIYKGFEDCEKKFITKLLKPDDIFFDIGANIGIHSLYAASILKNSGNIYSFEPALTTFNRLKENIQLNNWGELIYPFNLGLSNQSEQLTMHVASNGYDAWNSFADLKHVTLDDTIQANVIRFDEFISEHNIPHNKISLIKIDVEGWELMVLKGMGDLLADKDFNASFLMEFTEENVFRAGYACRDLFNYLLEKGYEWFEYDIMVNLLKPSELKAYYPYENLIAVKKGCVDAVNKTLSI